MSEPRWRQMLAAVLPGTRQKRERCPITLHRKRLFILPTGYGLVFAGLMFVMLVGSLNYNNALGLLMTFLLIVMAKISSFYCYRNLLSLSIASARLEDAFAEQPAQLTLTLHNPDPNPRFDIGLSVKDDETYGALGGNDQRRFKLQVATRQRGALRPPRCAIFTRYPLGLFKAWAWLRLNDQAVVYPKPEEHAPDWPASTGRKDGKDSFAQISGDEDFDHVRDYHYGDSPGKVAWKVAARRGKWASKAMSAPVHHEVWLRWLDTEGNDIEQRLSRLTAWVERAEQQGLRYGLEMPDQTIEPDNNEAHRRQCLRALALFGLPASPTGQGNQA